MKKQLIIILIFIFSIRFVNAQEVVRNDSLINATLDELLFEDDTDLYELFDGNTNLHFLYFGSTFNNKTFIDGTEFKYVTDELDSLPIRNASFQLYYFITNGLYFGASVSWYDKMEPSVRTSMFTLGYANGLNNFKPLRYRISYNRYIFLYSDPDNIAAFSNNINAGFTLRNKNLGLRFDYSMLTGTDSIAHKFSLDIYSKILLKNLGGINKIQLRPEISTSWGTAEVEEQYYVTHGTGSIFSEPVSTFYNKFGLLNTQLILPLNIIYKDFDFELAYIYNLPTTANLDYKYNDYVMEDIQKPHGYLQFSIGYFLRIK